MSNRKQNTQIGKIVRALMINRGTSDWIETHSDKRKDGTRRLAYKQFRYIPPVVRQDITNQIRAVLNALDLKYMDLGWKEGKHWGFGSYDYFYIVVRD